MATFNMFMILFLCTVCLFFSTLIGPVLVVSQNVSPCSKLNSKEF